MSQNRSAPSRRPLIGITTYPANAEGDFDLPADYVDAVRRAGAVPLLLPPGEPGWARELVERLDAVILTGGGDIGPAEYGGALHPTIYKIDRERDRSECALVRSAVDSGLPTLCICRGVQVLNVALGGTLVEHLPDVVGEEVAHRVDLPPGEDGDSSAGPAEHVVKVEPGSRLAGVVGALEFSCTSWHHQGLRDVAAGLDVVARASDGTIEAVELASHPWLFGVQWHPEITAEEDPIQQRLFDRLADAARAVGQGEGAGLRLASSPRGA